MKQSQASLYDQLLQVRYLANEAGYFDAADLITTHIDKLSPDAPLSTGGFCKQCNQFYPFTLQVNGQCPMGHTEEK